VSTSLSVSTTPAASPPEYNVTGIDFAQRHHLRYTGPIIDFHSHVTMTRPEEPTHGPAGGAGVAGSSDAAALMLAEGESFGVVQTISMCAVQDIAPLRQRLGQRLLFNAMISKKPDDPDSAAFETLERFLQAGIVMVKLWAAPRGRDRGLVVDAPWRIEALKRARAAGIRLVMVHVADPDVWFASIYADAAKYGTKPEQYERLMRVMDQFPDLVWIAAHMAGDPEHPDHLDELLTRYPNLYIDTSATKWQVREVSPRREAIRALILKHPTRFLFGTDLVTRHPLPREHYTSRYWCQRTLWESDWEGPSPIADPDYTPPPGQPSTPILRGLSLPPEVLRGLYYDNALRLLQLAGCAAAITQPQETTVSPPADKLG